MSWTKVHPHTLLNESDSYLVIGVPKDGDGDKRIASQGTFDECLDYADRNESPDNYERYYVAVRVD